MKDFSGEKISLSKKITESDLLALFEVGSTILGVLTVAQRLEVNLKGQGDACVALQWGQGSPLRFGVEAKTQNTPLMLRMAMLQARKCAQTHDALPLIVVPYLSPNSLSELEQDGVSGVDLCGNGIVVVPERLYVRATGQLNRFKQSRPLNNPYRGRSAMVARMLLAKPQWPSLNELVSTIQQAGCPLSLAQASKTVMALKDDLLVAKRAAKIELIEPQQLLNRLAMAWIKPQITDRRALRLPGAAYLVPALSAVGNLKWSVTGESSVQRYTPFAQGGPRQIGVSNLSAACAALGGEVETIPNFADVELLQTHEPGYYFKNEVDATGMRWASKLQTWLELQAGDARQRQVAQELYAEIVREVSVQ